MISAILIQQNKYIRRFEKLGATSYEQSLIPEENGIRKSMAFMKLIRQKIIVETREGRYYLDKLMASEQRQKRRTIVLILLVAIISALILITIFANYYLDGKLHVRQ